MFVWAKQKATDGRPQLQQEGWRREGKAIKTLGGGIKEKQGFPGIQKHRVVQCPSGVAKRANPRMWEFCRQGQAEVISNSRLLKTSVPLRILVLFTVFMLRVVFLGTAPWTLYPFFQTKVVNWMT